MKALVEHLLPVDTSTACDQLIDLVNVNSSSRNLPGLAQNLEMLLELFKPLGGVVERVDLEPEVKVDDRGALVPTELGQMGRIRQRPKAPTQLLFVGHYDTVFSVEHPFQRALVSDDRINGPGAADMKGGLLVMHHALSTLESSPFADNVGWEVLLTPDEELGSPGSAVYLNSAAANKAAGFIFEPSFPDGALAAARKGSGNFDLHVAGRAAHAGRDHHLGRNAVVAAAHLARSIDHLNGQWDEVTLNVGAITGGGPANIVPDSAVVRLNVRVPNRTASEEVAAALEQLAAETARTDGITVTMTGGFTRYPKEVSEGIRTLLTAAKASAATLGFSLEWRDTGGVSDGNNLAAAGLPNLDNLGVHGANIHVDSEYMFPASIRSRSHLAGLLLLEIASGALEVPR